MSDYRNFWTLKDGSLELIFYHQKIVSVTETSSKMASTLCQKMLTIFCQKAQNFVWFGPYDYVKISPACGPNTYQIMYEETLHLQCQHSQNGSIKCPIGKPIFAVNLPLKLFRDTVANVDIGSLNCLHTFLKKCLYHMLVKFDQNRMFQTTRHFDLYNKNQVFYNHF